MDVELSNDEAAFSDKESGKYSSESGKTTVFQHGKMAEIRKMGEAICKIAKRNNIGRCISMHFWPSR